MDVHSAIADAERLLPGVAAPAGDSDPRWQAIMRVADFIPAQSEQVWVFAARWGCTEDSDLRDAIATCVLEHLLQHDFERMFPRIESLARTNRQFAATVRMCWKFGEAELPSNAARLDALQAELNANAG